jgi:hypothetical protein
VRKGSTASWVGDHSQTTLWQIIGCGSRRRIELVPPLGAGFIVH